MDRRNKISISTSKKNIETFKLKQKPRKIENSTKLSDERPGSQAWYDTCLGTCLIVYPQAIMHVIRGSNPRLVTKSLMSVIFYLISQTFSYEQSMLQQLYYTYSNN